MRQFPALLAVVGLSALALTGCSAGGSADPACERPSATGGGLDHVTVSGEFSRPSVTLAERVVAVGTVFGDVTAGDGPAVVSADQEAQFTIAIADGETGEVLLQGAAAPTFVSNWETDYPVIAEMLMCASAGSRIVAAAPAGGFSAAAAESLGMTEDSSAVIAIDLQNVFLARADGTPQRVGSSHLPSVVLAPDGRPGIVVPSSSPPEELSVEVLKEGDGEAVGAGASVRVQYTGVTWAEREVFDSSWSRGTPTTFPLDTVVPGFAQALEGKTVGSQVLVVIPPDLGYEDRELPGIPAGSTLIFVIDILGIDTAEN
ncbi:FKBP-type peptidyl-prolyl cis-trans isomerase [Microbacterium sp. No. 7]|uniref:FKBP-type peptidyl-prolyl cis-trans isomerase n=1 Tax=Microbacterium sp. No. 7 TaxID=1714373 RepID=UPI0006D14493|nr:FKBP-type peptidyl-prolyl cis-trans isomerase [Microbacterium sp. No. 7]ALJ20229.1 peptidylprolyl isomerase [Microbacterium sp. No. 7]